MATRTRGRRLGQALVALGATAAVTAGFRLGPANITTVGFVYLLVVLAAASVFGLPEALTASVAAAAQYNFYFLPPQYTFTIADTPNWVALAAFLVTAVVASELSATAQRQAREAQLRRREINQLYELSRASLLADPDDPIPHLERALVAIFGFEDARVELRGQAGAAAGAAWPLRVGQTELGVLRVQAAPVDPERSEAVASIVAIVLARALALRESSRLRGVRESEALKTALLDSVTHDLRTPLTSIKAAVTALLGDNLGEGSAGAARRDLLAAIDEESDQLNRILQNVLDMARIETGDLRLAPTPQALLPILEAALAQARLAPDRVRITLPPELPQVSADGPLLSQALFQLLANAAAYSAPDRPIEITAGAYPAGVTLAIRDHGPGIAPEVLPRIFDKFFRDPQARQARPEGLGMGLAIARGIIQAHGGTLQASSEPGAGACFQIVLPQAAAAAAPYGDAHPDC